MEDKKRILRDERPFSYKLVGEKALIFYRLKHVYTAAGKEYRKLTKAIDSADEYLIQMALAKVTGQFKHGNER